MSTNSVSPKKLIVLLFVSPLDERVNGVWAKEKRKNTVAQTINKRVA